MKKMTSETLEQAIHQIAGEANAPHTPPHVMQENSDGQLSEADEIHVKRVVNNKMKAAIPELDDIINILLKMDKSHKVVSPQDFKTLNYILKKLPEIKARINKN